MQLQTSLVKGAFTASIPVCMGYIPLGIVFGFLCVQAGAPWWIPPISSILIYGGAVQYMMIPMLAADMSVASIAFATAVVNLRHVFYGLSLLDRLHTAGWKKWLIAFLLTDETYSLITTEKKDAPIDRLVLIALFDYSWWILGSLIGGLLGAAATIELAGFDFVLTSLFAMLLCEQWRGRVNSKPLWVALIGYAVARFISADNALAIAISICALSAILFAFQKNPLPKIARSAGGSSHE